MTCIAGGVNIAMKVPAHQYDGVVAFYRETLECEEIEGGADVSFRFGPNRLWIDRVPQLSRAEIWLELVSKDFGAAAQKLEQAGIVRDDGIEPLPETMTAGWFFNPAGIVHLLRLDTTP
ncbi:hypothetical protein [Devosia marina]|jgi:hypothetical protein|uniref:Glyoxalase-like domain-containing protein n=1 Tax=Devosia marina TaxID=2683198 RepID=A0A7X3FRP7_9HYPH|nr:hypothetical protein [Devosia marina]MVS99567.1 hypothetical protein [Devosia marina]